MILKSVFQIMVFSSLVSCIAETDDSPDIETTSHVEILNTCNGVIFFQESRRLYGKPDVSIKWSKYTIQPNNRYIINGYMADISRKDFLLPYYPDKDTVWFQNNDKIIYFVGPMRFEDDSIRNYYNVNSWDSIQNPNNENKFIFRFTLTDKDFE